MLELPLVLNWRIHHSYTFSSHFFLFLPGFREWRWSSSSFSQTGLCGYRLLMAFIFIKLNKSLAADGSWNQHRTDDVNSDISLRISDVFAFDETDETWFLPVLNVSIRYKFILITSFISLIAGTFVRAGGNGDRTGQCLGRGGREVQEITKWDQQNEKGSWRGSKQSQTADGQVKHSHTCQFKYMFLLEHVSKFTVSYFIYCSSYFHS